jgi:hypothetical protein
VFLGYAPEGDMENLAPSCLCFTATMKQAVSSVCTPAMVHCLTTDAVQITMDSNTETVRQNQPFLLSS